MTSQSYTKDLRHGQIPTSKSSAILCAIPTSNRPANILRLPTVSATTSPNTVLFQILKQRKLYEETVKPDAHQSDILHQWLKNFHEAHDAEYLLQFQLCENLHDQPVEYAGKVWDPEKYPWQTVARLVVPKQDSFNYELKTFWEDHMRVDPWLGLKAMQPLGSPNRLRRVVYPASSKLRRIMNGRKEINVTSMDQIPGPPPPPMGHSHVHQPLKVN